MKEYLKTSNVYVILGYLVGLVLSSLLGMLIVCNIASALYDIPSKEAINLLSVKTLEGLSQNKIDAYYFMQSWNNLLSYFVIAIIVIFFGRGYLYEDVLDLKKNKMKNFLYVGYAILGCALLYDFSVLFSYLAGLLSDTNSSANQTSFELMIENGYGAIVFFSVVFLAPICEELVYRKAIFKFFKNKKQWYLPLIISSLVFALPHMITTKEGFLVWVILFISYYVSGLILGLVYHFSNDNIYISVLCHMLNNLLAFLLIIWRLA